MGDKNNTSKKESNMKQKPKLKPKNINKTIRGIFELDKKKSNS